MPRPDPFGARAPLGEGLPGLLAARRPGRPDRSRQRSGHARILLENALRNAGGGLIEPADVETSRRGGESGGRGSVHAVAGPAPGLHGRPPIVDLAAMRDAMADLGGDPAREPAGAADLVIDHSVQVDQFGTPGAFAFNVAVSTTATASATSSCDGPRPPFAIFGWSRPARASSTRSTSSSSPRSSPSGPTRMASGSPPTDTVVGTDSHTTMVNGLGVLAWGVGGSRPRRPCWASRSTCPCPGSSGPASGLGLDGDGPRPRGHRCSGRSESSARSWSSPATGWPGSRSPTARRSPT